jgi:transposase-like protein
MLLKYTKCSQNIPNANKIYQMTMEKTKIFQCKAFQIISKLGFWFEKIPSGNPGLSEPYIHT